jgi:hypothetical protein
MRAAFTQWVFLHDFSTLRDRYPAGDTSLADVLVASNRPDAIQRFVALSGADADLVTATIDALTARVFDVATTLWSSEPPDLGTLEGWTRFADALAMAVRTGATPERLLAWARTREIDELATGPATRWITWAGAQENGADRSSTNAGLAQEAKNIVRARYDEDRWRAEARTLNDGLRERRRTAHGDVKDQAGNLLRSAVHATHSVEPGAGRSAGAGGPCPLGMDEGLPRVGGEPEGAAVRRVLHRGGTTR